MKNYKKIIIAILGSQLLLFSATNPSFAKNEETTEIVIKEKKEETVNCDFNFHIIYNDVYDCEERTVLQDLLYFYFIYNVPNIDKKSKENFVDMTLVNLIHSYLYECKNYFTLDEKEFNKINKFYTKNRFNQFVREKVKNFKDIKNDFINSIEKSVEKYEDKIKHLKERLKENDTKFFIKYETEKKIEKIKNRNRDITKKRIYKNSYLMDKGKNDIIYEINFNKNKIKEVKDYIEKIKNINENDFQNIFENKFIVFNFDKKENQEKNGPLKTRKNKYSVTVKLTDLCVFDDEQNKLQKIFWLNCLRETLEESDEPAAKSICKKIKKNENDNNSVEKIKNKIDENSYCYTNWYQNIFNAGLSRVKMYLTNKFRNEVDFNKNDLNLAEARLLIKTINSKEFDNKLEEKLNEKEFENIINKISNYTKKVVKLLEEKKSKKSVNENYKIKKIKDNLNKRINELKNKIKRLENKTNKSKQDKLDINSSKLEIKELEKRYKDNDEILAEAKNKIKTEERMLNENISRGKNLLKNIKNITFYDFKNMCKITKVKNAEMNII